MLKKNSVCYSTPDIGRLRLWPTEPRVPEKEGGLLNEERDLKQRQ